jgi:uncharacterized protein YaaR (DUF327 family)
MLTVLIKWAAVGCYNHNLMDSKKLSEDPSTKELNQFVQTMLKQMQERFDDMSSNIVSRVEEMGRCCLIQESALTTSRKVWAKS